MREKARRKAAVSLIVVLLSSLTGQNALAEGADMQIARPPVIEPVMENTTIVNGDFEKSTDGFGNPEGWNVWVSKTRDKGGSVSYSISQEDDNVNDPTRKLTLYNGMDEDVMFSVTQTVYGASYPTGSYVASLIYEGMSGEGDSGIWFTVNGKRTGFGVLEGWQSWKQAAVRDIGLVQGEPVELTVSGRLCSKGFLDLDDVELVLESQFTERHFVTADREEAHPSYEPAREAPELIVGSHIQNGDFEEGLEWDVYGYPGGYLPKWKIEAGDLSGWEYRITNGVLEFKNIRDSEDMDSIKISQKVHLKPGSYLLHGETGWVWDEGNEDGICMRVEDQKGVLIGERYWNPGYGRIISDVIVVRTEMDVTVSITIQLPGGKTAAIDRLEITEAPRKITWHSARQVGGVSGKADTEKIRVTFSCPVFGLEEKHFTVEDAVVTEVVKDGDSGYLLELQDVAFANKKEIEVKIETPEYYRLDTRKKRVMVYRDTDVASGLKNSDFTGNVSWDRENYPDGYIPGWSLSGGVDWDIWRYNIADGMFRLTNISDSPAKAEFIMHQAVSIPKGTYSIKTNSPGTGEGRAAGGVHAQSGEENIPIQGSKGKIQMQVREGKKILVDVSGTAGQGVIQSDTFTVKKDTMVDCILIFSLSGGETASLRYISLLPTEELTWESAFQIGGEPGKKTTEAVGLVFDRDVEGLTADCFSVKGAGILYLQPMGDGAYNLGISSLSVLDGEEIFISLDAPGGYLARPDVHGVKVYRAEGQQEYSANLVNGDFSTGVDWENPSYPDGYVEGWSLPDPLDWDAWSYGTPDGVFEVTNKGTKASDFVIRQEIILPAGIYLLEAESPYGWGNVADSGIMLIVEGENGILAQGLVQPGGGKWGTNTFELAKAAKVTVKICMTAAPESGMGVDNVAFQEQDAMLASVSWESAVQSGGEDGTADSTGIVLEFSQDIPELTAGLITITGANKGSLARIGEGKYLLDVSVLAVENGKTVTVDVKAPDGYLITPSSRKVTVYKAAEPEIPDIGEFADPVVNGDFSVGVDWGNPSYPDGYVKGWNLPDPFDWDTWNYGTPDGVFEAANKGAGTSEFVIWQEISLPAGIYILKADSPYGWGDQENSQVGLIVEGEAGILERISVRPGDGSFQTKPFEMTEEGKVRIKIQMTVAAESGAGVDNVRFEKMDAMPAAVSWESAVQSGGEDGTADSTGIILEFSQDIPNLTAGQITVAGAGKGLLTSEGKGKYYLAISGLTVENGEDVTVEIKAPDGYLITPASRKVTVYKEAEPDIPDIDEFVDPVINGDFSVGVDWDAGGTIEGWSIDSVDWSVWSSYSGAGGDWGNFWVNRTSAESDTPLSLRQELELEAGTYQLCADSQGNWDEALTDALTLCVEESGNVLASKSVQPGYGSFSTDAFTLGQSTTIEVVIAFKLPADGEMGIDNVSIQRDDSARSGKIMAVQKQPKEEYEKATASDAVISDEDEWILDEDEWMEENVPEATPSDAWKEESDYEENSKENTKLPETRAMPRERIFGKSKEEDDGGDEE